MLHRLTRKVSVGTWRNRAPVCALLLAAMTQAGCGLPAGRVPVEPSPLLTPSVAGARTASYVIRTYRLAGPASREPRLRAKLILSDEHPAALAHLHFWEAGAFDPERHWNREADRERCPKCDPQYDLHFTAGAFEAVLRHLRTRSGTVRLTYCRDDWAVESTRGGLPPVWSKP